MATTKAPQTKADKIALVAAAMAHVYTVDDELVQDFARESCIANMGQSLTDYIGQFRNNDTGKLVRYAYDAFYQQSESDEMARMLDDERKSFLKDAKKCLAQVKKAKQPLTLGNMRDAYLGQGPFKKQK